MAGVSEVGCVGHCGENSAGKGAGLRLEHRLACRFFRSKTAVDLGHGSLLPATVVSVARGLPALARCWAWPRQGGLSNWALSIPRVGGVVGFARSGWVAVAAGLEGNRPRRPSELRMPRC